MRNRVREIVHIALRNWITTFALYYNNHRRCMFISKNRLYNITPYLFKSNRLCHIDVQFLFHYLTCIFYTKWWYTTSYYYAIWSTDKWCNAVTHFYLCSSIYLRPSYFFVSFYCILIFLSFAVAATTDDNANILACNRKSGRLTAGISCCAICFKSWSMMYIVNDFNRWQSLTIISTNDAIAFSILTPNGLCRQRE